MPVSGGVGKNKGKKSSGGFTKAPSKKGASRGGDDEAAMRKCLDSGKSRGECMRAMKDKNPFQKMGEKG